MSRLLARSLRIGQLLQSRNLLHHINVPLDGFFEGPKGNCLGLHLTQPKKSILRRFSPMRGALLEGRAYRVLERYWPSATGKLAQQMNG